MQITLSRDEVPVPRSIREYIHANVKNRSFPFGCPAARCPRGRHSPRNRSSGSSICCCSSIYYCTNLLSTTMICDHKMTITDFVMQETYKSNRLLSAIIPFSIYPIYCEAIFEHRDPHRKQSSYSIQVWVFVDLQVRELGKIREKCKLIVYWRKLLPIETWSTRFSILAVSTCKRSQYFQNRSLQIIK